VFVISLSRPLCGATKTYAPNRASCRTGAERIQHTGVDVADDLAIFPCPAERNGWPLHNRGLPMKESRQAPVGHLGAHPRGSPGCALFTFAQGAVQPWGGRAWWAMYGERAEGGASPAPTEYYD
jgi:hypothetical protein